MDTVDATVDRGGFGELLRAFRRAAGVSQQQLAERVGISLAAIRDLEQGRTRQPQRRFVAAMVTALNLTGDAEAAFRLAADGADRARPARHVDPGQPLRIQILGPLSVHRGPAHVPVGRGSRRAVLARLALSANTTVPVADLVDLLWDTQPPPAPAHAVQTYLSRLRSALQPAGAGRAGIVSRTPGGYQLNLTDDQLDLTDFRRRVREARTVEPARALDLVETALALWRGSPLADIPQLRDHPLVTAVVEERIAVTLRYADLALAAGQADRCLPRVRELAAASPLHEPLHARLIAVLAASNLQAAALAAYTDIRRRLVEDLGIEPGPELVEAHRRVLRREPARPVPGTPPGAPPPSAHEHHRPAQLPADIHRFTGRVAALSQLDGILSAHHHAPAVVITAVSGTAGVGKTALAVHWAHRVRHRFPDGQLYVNLRGFHPTGAAMTANEALHGFLIALGMPPPRIPADLDAQSALYRTLLADRRLLVLLDNACDADQVRPLLPGAPGCLVLITSRSGLTGLVAAEAAQPLPLDLLTLDEARDLLAQRLGTDRTAIEPDAVDEIVERCARLPLALAIAAARAATRPNAPLAELAADLGDSRGRLDALTTGDPGTDVRAVFACSYRRLGPAAARLFRLLGIFPGTEASVLAVASLAALEPGGAQAALVELAQAHLITEIAPGRYGMHDLLRAYAGERSRTDGELREAARRLLDHYLHSALAAAQILSAQRRPPTVAPPDPSALVVPLADEPQALAFLATEQRTLLALFAFAERHACDGHAPPLAWALTDFLQRRGLWSDQVTVHTAALEAARRTDDQAAQAQTHRHLSRAYIMLERLDEAGAHLHSALRLAELIDDVDGQAHTHLNMANLQERTERYAEALSHALEGLRLFTASHNRAGRARALNMVGWFHGRLGRFDEALVHCQEALSLLGEIGDREGQVFTWDSMGFIHHHGGRYAEAEDCYGHALQLTKEIDGLYAESIVLHHLGDTHAAVGDPAAAAHAFRRSWRILDELGHADAAAVRAKLDGL
jgi:DNA-binding SARP family transcriptional activator/tetratricopeptide (TPR) repeat protein/DNA-binding XRE family transcriptional regulator